MQPTIVREKEFIRLSTDFANQGIPFLFLINFEKTAFFICKLDQAADQDVFFDIKGYSNWQNSCNNNIKKLTLKLHPISRKKYSKAFRIVQDGLCAGNSYLTNLTFPTLIETRTPFYELFQCSRAPYKLLFGDQFVIFSPECFVKIEEDHIFSYPMKGTIDAAIPDAKFKILEDKKEYAEHVTIVDLIRNDLSMVATKVEVTRFRYIDYISTNRKNLLQVSSEIRGELKKDWKSDFGRLILKLLPAGSISGAPKAQTVEIIQKAERQNRGWFTGIFGVFDGKNLDSAVNIRFIEKMPNDKLQFRSGGGITVFSDEEKEYNEMLDKVYVPSI